MAERKTRSLEHVRSAKRSALRSLWHSHTRGPDGFLRENVWPWLWNYLRVAFTPRRRFPSYLLPASPPPGIRRLPDACTIGVAGDWGTGTTSAYAVADRLGSHGADVTIHLGDVYYSGTAEEFRDYFFPAWPRGRHGTYILNSNHEMYSGGAGYLAALKELQQPASYVCLENRYWRILALDTGYYSRILPLLEAALAGCVRLQSEQRSWLEQVVFADRGDTRPVILLTHHQWFSAFDTEYRRIGASLAPYLDRVVLWLWGHEHRFAGYGSFGFGKGPKVRARCLGHGGMPVELGEPVKRPDRNLVVTDDRKAYVIGDRVVGHCGYAVLHLDGPELRIEYRDELPDAHSPHGRRILEERWTSRTAGKVTHASPELTLHAPGDVERLTR